MVARGIFMIVGAAVCAASVFVVASEAAPWARVVAGAVLVIVGTTAYAILEDSDG